MWSYVTKHFQDFLNNIELSPEDHKDALGKAKRIGECLHRKYYQGEFNPNNVLLVGSYGKRTAMRLSTDIDMLYFLPHDEFYRFNSYASGGQSALLQEIKSVLAERFSTTEKIKADGQVVQVNYDSYKFEVVPAFRDSEGIYICHTGNGGSWKKIDPSAELDAIDSADAISRGSARPLIKYFKAWKSYKNVEINSIAIEIVVCDYFLNHPYLHRWLIEIGRNKSPLWWHDWFVADCFKHLNGFSHASIPGTGEIIPIGNCWITKASTANEIGGKACEYEKNDSLYSAENQWRQIFGSKFPQTSTFIDSLAWLANNSPARGSTLLTGLRNNFGQ
jgi:SMODS domain-containing protein